MIADRLQLTLDCSSSLLFNLEGRVYSSSTARLTGFELAERLRFALRFRRQLDAAISDMQAALESAPTPQQVREQTLADDADPEAAARRYGWRKSEEIWQAAIDAKSQYADLIRHARGHIALPHNFTTWEEFFKRMDVPARQHAYFADCLHFADDWKDALAETRKLQDKSRSERMNRLLQGDAS